MKHTQTEFVNVKSMFRWIYILGRSPGEGKGYPLQYSGLENSIDCIVHGVTKSQTRLSDFHIRLGIAEEKKSWMLSDSNRNYQKRMERRKALKNEQIIRKLWENYSY